MTDVSLLRDYLTNFWQWLFVFIPNLLGALVVFLIGWVVASVMGKFIQEVLVRVGFNKVFDKTGWDDAFTKAEIKLNPSEFLGKIVKLTIILIFLMPAVELLGLREFSQFIHAVINYIPHVFVVAFMVAVAGIFADVVAKIVVASVEKTGVGYSLLAGQLVKWAVWFFVILSIIAELQVFGELLHIMNTIITGIVGILVLAFGLSFGLGGKDVAAELLKDLKDKLRKK